MKSADISFITINGKEDSKISVVDHGLLYGDGVFDTFRVFDGKAFRMEDHLNRLFSSLKEINLEIPYSKAELIKIIQNTYKKSKLKDQFIRIIVTRGIGEQGIASDCKPNVIIITNNRDFKPLEKITLCISDVRKVNEKAINPKIKSLNYMNNVLAFLDAKKKGKQDSLLLNEKNEISEATTSNIFIIKNKQLLTPSLNSGILEGITRKVIMENFPVKEVSLSIEDVLSADEVFLSGTANFITSVSSVNEKEYKKFDYSKKVFDKLMQLAKEEKPL